MISNGCAHEVSTTLYVNTLSTDLRLVCAAYDWLREQTWLHQKLSLTPAPSELSVVMSHWPQPKLSRTSPTQRPSSGPDPRENSGVEIHHTLPPSPMTVWAPNTWWSSSWSQDRLHPSDTHHRSRSASTGSSSVACSEQAQKECFHVYTNCRSNTQIGKSPRTRQRHQRKSAADFEKTSRVRG